MFFGRLQMARGWAAIAVLLAHANSIADRTLFGGHFIAGRAGVDFFFVLSGFIICASNARHVGQPGAAAEYARRRAERILPMYWAVTLGALALHLVVLATTQFRHDTLYWTHLDGVGLLRSLLLWPAAPGSPTAAPVLPVAWTLSYELFFYVVFALMFSRHWRVLAPAAVACWVGVIGAALAGAIVPAGDLAAMVCSPRNLEFLLGCLAGWAAVSGWRALHSPAFVVAAIVGSATFLGWALWGAPPAAQPAREVLTIGVPCFVLVLGLAGMDLQAKPRPSTSNAVWLFLGNASYSIYLVHFVLIELWVWLARAAFGLQGVPLFASAAAVALVAGCLAHSMVEKPLTEGLKRLRGLAGPRPAAS